MNLMKLLQNKYGNIYLHSNLLSRVEDIDISQIDKISIMRKLHMMKTIQKKNYLIFIKDFNLI